MHTLHLKGIKLRIPIKILAKKDIKDWAWVSLGVILIALLLPFIITFNLGVKIGRKIGLKLWEPEISESEAALYLYWLKWSVEMQAHGVDYSTMRTFERCIGCGRMTNFGENSDPERIELCLCIKCFTKGIQPRVYRKDLTDFEEDFWK